MPDNLVLNSGSGGSTLAAASLSISGDTAIVQMVGCGILSGSEGSWVHSQLVGGAGAVAAGVQRVTLASDDPAVVDLAAIEVLITSGNALLTAIDTDTGNIATSVASVDGKITACNTGAVVISSGTVTANLGAVDNAVLDAIAASLAGTLTVGSHAVTNAGTFAVQVDGDALTALQLIDDIVHSGDAAVSKYAAIGAVYDDTTPGTVTENQAQSLRMSSERYLYTEIRDAAGNERGMVVDASGYITTNINGTVTVGSHAVTNAGTFAVQISDTSFAVADGNALGEGVLIQGDDGTDRKNINVDATTGDVQVDVTNTVTVDCNSSNVTVDGVPAPLSVTGGGTEAAAMRVTLANDSTGVISVDDNGGALTVDWAGTAPPIGAGTEAAALRVTLATDSTGLVSVDDNASSLTVDTTGTSGLEVVQVTAADLNVTEASAAAIKTAVEIIDDWDDGSDHCEVVGADAEDANVTGKPVLVGGRYDSTARTLDTTDVGAIALSSAGETIAIQQGKYVQYGDERCEVKHFGTVTSTDDTSLITAVASKRFLVLSLYMAGKAATATDIALETKTTNTGCFWTTTDAWPIAADADGDNSPGVVMPHNPHGWFKTADTNEDLALRLSAAQKIGIYGTYIEFTP